MNAEQIRALPDHFAELQEPKLGARIDADSGKIAALKLTLLVEIAAQLAEINAALEIATRLFCRAKNAEERDRNR